MSKNETVDSLLLPFPRPASAWSNGTPSAVFFQTENGELISHENKNQKTTFLHLIWGTTEEQKQALERQEVENEKEKLESIIQKTEITNKIKL